MLQITNIHVQAVLSQILDIPERIDSIRDATDQIHLQLKYFSLQLMNTLEINIIRCKKLATCTWLIFCRPRACLFSTDEGSCYVFPS